MDRNAAVAQTRNGFLRFLEFVAWVAVLVTYFGFIGYLLSAERGFRPTMWFIAVFAIACGLVALAHTKVHWRYQRHAGIAALVAGVAVCVFI